MATAHCGRLTTEDQENAAAWKYFGLFPRQLGWHPEEQPPMQKARWPN